MLTYSEINALTSEYQRRYDIDAQDARRICTDAADAAKSRPELEAPLRSWLDGQHPTRDVRFDAGASLLVTARLLCPEDPDIPLACRLLALHLDGICPGITAAVGEVCYAEEGIFGGDAVTTAFKTEDGWFFLGKTAAENDRTKPDYSPCELWQIMERSPKLLPLILYPYFVPGTIILRDGGFWSVRCPADGQD